MSKIVCIGGLGLQLQPFSTVFSPHLLNMRCEIPQVRGSNQLIFKEIINHC